MPDSAPDAVPIPQVEYRDDITVVMPVRDSMRFLPRVVPPLIEAGRHHGGVLFVFVDNGSTDGSHEYLQSLTANDVRVIRRDAVSVGALRNLGATHGEGAYLSFIDADCEIGAGYFAAALGDLETSGAAATGYPYALPASPGWIERIWYDLHHRDVARDVTYLNAGNFFVRRAAFERVGGFRDDLRSGEDAELGQRMNDAGDRIHANPAVRAVHLGNPGTVRDFYRRAVWHGIGMFGTVRRGSIDKPTAMMAAHIVATLAGVVALVLLPAPVTVRVSVLGLLQLVVPAVTVIYRAVLVGRLPAPVHAVFLYWLYYWARIHSLMLIARGHSSVYRK
jgi:glycosyltransferase involved in cell wall biosynthesis